MKTEKNISRPSNEQVEQYLQKWNTLENYHLQEDALNKLFFSLCPNNKEITDILLKVATLNDFYSTNIFSVYPVAKHILSLDIDERLKAGDISLVTDIQKVKFEKDVLRNFYSFATKYCSHHNPTQYPIYDRYVEKILCYFKDVDHRLQFKTSDLKIYPKFKETLLSFRDIYSLEQYNLKEIDRYLWLLGKESFPKNYGKKTKKQN